RAGRRSPWPARPGRGQRPGTPGRTSAGLLRERGRQAQRPHLVVQLLHEPQRLRVVEGEVERGSFGGAERPEQILPGAEALARRGAQATRRGRRRQREATGEEEAAPLQGQVHRGGGGPATPVQIAQRVVELERREARFRE